MKKQIKRLKKDNKKLNDKLNFANATVHGLMKESAALKKENEDLKEQIKKLTEYGISKVEDLAEMYEGQMRVCEKSNHRKDIIINYLEMKILDIMETK